MKQYIVLMAVWPLVVQCVLDFVTRARHNKGK